MEFKGESLKTFHFISASRLETSTESYYANTEAIKETLLLPKKKCVNIYLFILVWWWGAAGKTFHHQAARFRLRKAARIED